MENIEISEKCKKKVNLHKNMQPIFIKAIKSVKKPNFRNKCYVKDNILFLKINWIRKQIVKGYQYVSSWEQNAKIFIIE